MTVLSQLALELVAKLDSTENILARHNLDAARLKQLLQEPAFKQQLKEAKQYWKSPEAIRERIQQKTGMLVEDSIMEMYTLVHDADLHPAARLDAFKILARMANLEDPQKKEIADTRIKEDKIDMKKQVQININLGGDDDIHRSVTVGASVDTDSADAAEGQFITMDER